VCILMKRGAYPPIEEECHHIEDKEKQWTYMSASNPGFTTAPKQALLKVQMVTLMMALSPHTKGAMLLLAFFLKVLDLAKIPLCNNHN
jgi:hypothetical protein